MAKRVDRWRGEKTPKRSCAVGLVEALEILHARGVSVGPECAKAAALAGCVDVLAFLRRTGTSFGASQTLDISSLFDALASGSDYHARLTLAMGEIVGRVVMTLAFGPSMVPEIKHADRRVMSLVDMVARNGHVDAVAWLVNVGGAVPTTMAMDCAAARGHIDVVRWLHANCNVGCTTAAMDMAALSGRLDIVTFLHAHRTEGCTAAAMDGAAAGGHLDVVAFLHKHRDEGCTTTAIDSAATAGHASVVRFLCENRTEGFTRATIHEAEAAGHLHIASYLAHCAGPSDAVVQESTIRGPFAPCADIKGDIDSNGIGTDNEGAGTQTTSDHLGADLHEAFAAAVLKGDIAAMDRIHHEQGFAVDALASRAHQNYWTMAVMIGRIDVLQWLNAHNVDGRNCGVITTALVVERLDVARWLYAHGVRDNMSDMIDDAAAEGEADPVRAAYDQYASVLALVPGVADMVAQVRRLAERLAANTAPSPCTTPASGPRCA
nr:ankyrin repeat [Pandoravirus massiliensis]